MIGAMQLPPQNVPIEREVIGAMILDNSIIGEIMVDLLPDDFFRDSHQAICRAIYAMHDAGQPVDILTLADHMERASTLASVGGISAIEEIVNQTPHAASGGYHAAIVTGHAMCRRLIEVANQAREKAYAYEATYEEQIRELSEKVQELAMWRTPRSVRTGAEVIAGTLARLEARSRGEFDGLTTGIAPLDAMLGGFGPGNLIVIGARPSMGKTAFALQILEHVALKREGGVLLFSIEMDKDEIGERLLSMRSRISSHRFKKPALMDDREHRAVQKAGVELTEASFWVDDSSVLDATSLAASARRYAASHHIQCVIVDYLGLLELRDANTRMSRQEEVSKLSRSLKRLAKELGIPVILLSQLNRLAEQREDHRPKLSDLRESGSVEQDANIVLLLHRPAYYDPDDRPGVVEVIVAKNRNGAVGSIELAWVGALTRFEALEGRLNEAERRAIDNAY
jgi:replicative DNA helicase